MHRFIGRMKLVIIPIFNHLSAYWDDPGDAPSIVAQFHRLLHLYSKHHNQSPRSADLSNAFVSRKTPAEDDVMCDLLTFPQEHLCSARVDTPHEGEHDPCLQRPSECEHSPYR